MNEASPLYVMGCDWYFPLSDSHQEFSTRAFLRPLWELHRVHPKLSLFLVRDYIPPATEVHLLCRPSGVFNHRVCCGGREHFCLSSTGSRYRSFLRQCLLLKGPRMFRKTASWTVRIVGCSSPVAGCSALEALPLHHDLASTRIKRSTAVLLDPL